MTTGSAERDEVRMSTGKSEYAFEVDPMGFRVKPLGGGARSGSRNAERARRERAVVEAAKAFTNDNVLSETWDVLAAYRRLCKVVDDLTRFEALQEKKD